MKDWWGLAVAAGLVSVAGVIGAVLAIAKFVSQLVEAGKSVQDVPRLRADLEAFKVSLRTETHSEAEKIEKAMDARFAVLEKENNQRMEQIQHSVDARFEQVTHMLGGLKESMHETLASLEKQMTGVSTNIEWLKRSTDADHRRRHEEQSGR